MIRLFFLLGLLSSLIYRATAQEVYVKPKTLPYKNTLSLGFGFPSLIHAEYARSFGFKHELAFNGGFLVDSEFSVFDVGLTHRIHYQSSKKYQNLPTWFFFHSYNYQQAFERAEASLMGEQSDDEISIYSLAVGLGSKVYFSPRAGMTFSFGIGAAYFADFDGESCLICIKNNNKGAFFPFGDLRIAFNYRF